MHNKKIHYLMHMCKGTFISRSLNICNSSDRNTILLIGKLILKFSCACENNILTMQVEKYLDRISVPKNGQYTKHDSSRVPRGIKI